jgi:hypothetical protein
MSIIFDDVEQLISRLAGPLSPRDRAAFRRARHKARAELQAELAYFGAEIEALQHDYHELALALHRDRYNAALDKAIMQRAMDADIVLH